MNKNAEYPSMQIEATYNFLMNQNRKLIDHNAVLVSERMEMKALALELLEALRLSADNRPVWATLHGIYDVIAKAEAVLK